MIRFLEQSAVVRHTERFFTLRKLEQQAGRSLAEAAADVGDSLIQIKDELAREGTQTWTEWLAHQAEHAREQGLEPIAERRAREYMALARFRIATGERFALFLHIDPACLFPILSLPAEQVGNLLENGVKTSTGLPSRSLDPSRAGEGTAKAGATKPLETATRAEVRAAVAELKGTSTGAAAPVKAATQTRADKLAAIKKQIAALGDLSDAERDELLAVCGVPAENASENTQPTGATAPVPTVQAYSGRLGPITLQGGRFVLGTRDRTTLANDAIAAIDAARQKALMVPAGTGTLKAGHKTSATSAVELLRKAVLGWPAWR